MKKLLSAALAAAMLLSLAACGTVPPETSGLPDPTTDVTPAPTPTATPEPTPTPLPYTNPLSGEPMEEDIIYSEQVLKGIQEHEAEIDDIINELSIGWRIERMPKVDLCVLRVAIYEMLYRDDIPCGVSINEAVELAKQFGGDRSSAYINGMLGTFAKRIEGEPQA